MTADKVIAAPRQTDVTPTRGPAEDGRSGGEQRATAQYQRIVGALRRDRGSRQRFV